MDSGPAWWRQIDDPSYPASDFSYYDALEFTQQLNEAVSQERYYLPTAAEWEYACRAGTTTRWSFGDDESELGNYAWYRANASDVFPVPTQIPGPQPVGTKLPNPWGYMICMATCLNG
jgi:formylglycine-generating enzyme required for sulfatase activity